MQVRNHGKYTKMNKNSPRAIGTCQGSGLMARLSDIVLQREYRGRGLVSTGKRIYKKFLDDPNPQNLTPRIKLDPVPVANARPDNQIEAQGTLATSVGVLSLDVSGNSNITLTAEQFDNGEFNFTGVLTGNIIIYVPNTYNQFFANNLTTGGFILSMQIEGMSSGALVIPHAPPPPLKGPMVVNTFINLKFVNF